MERLRAAKIEKIGKKRFDFFDLYFLFSFVGSCSHEKFVRRIVSAKIAFDSFCAFSAQLVSNWRTWIKCDQMMVMIEILFCHVFFHCLLNRWLKVFFVKLKMRKKHRKNCEAIIGVWNEISNSLMKTNRSEEKTIGKIASEKSVWWIKNKRSILRFPCLDFFFTLLFSRPNFCQFRSLSLKFLQPILHDAWCGQCAIKCHFAAIEQTNQKK